ncbi:DUF4232 domain-containing protein [Actinacidiphila paucisporea]|uniref:DUF4232 domain-containing protein n=1 Tax=Actinacidiphila paucisporea TaxID=310782 RepID=UPI001161545E|nr:DUF4232 domain-containing protein [Actinacidiphila paucisporea]
MKSALPSALSSSAVLLLGALALTACQSGSTEAAGGPAPSHRTSAAASAPTTVSPPTTEAPVPTASATTAPTTAAPQTKPMSGTGGGTDTDAYAWKHPCAIEQLTVRVTARAGAPTQRVIAVRNNGGQACGLSYYPRVYLDSAKSADGTRAVKPRVPGGLGGPPAYPVHARQTAYAVIDLDPSGATTGTAPGVDELNVLPDADHMPAAATESFPLGKGALVLRPKLGLYRTTVADAVASMKSADTQL